MLSKEIGKLVHYAEGVIIFAGDLFQTVFQGLYDLFTLNWLFDGQVEVHKLMVQLVEFHGDFKLVGVFSGLKPAQNHAGVLKIGNAFGECFIFQVGLAQLRHDLCCFVCVFAVVLLL